MDEALNRFGAAAPQNCQLALDTQSLSRRGRRTSAQNQIYHRGWRLAYLMATNVGDHLAAIGDVASANPPRVFAHMTLARAALEGAAKINYLLHPSGTLPDRVLRAAALLLASAEEELKAAAELATGNPMLHAAATAGAQRRQADILELVARADIEVRRRKRGGQLSGVSWRDAGGGEAQAHPSVTGLLKTLLPTKPAAYRVGSGAVHSQPWVLDDDDAFDPMTRRLEWHFDPAALAGSVDLAITASVVALEAFAAMLGQDPSRERIEAKHREQAVSKLVMPLLRR